MELLHKSDKPRLGEVKSQVASLQFKIINYQFKMIISVAGSRYDFIF